MMRLSFFGYFNLGFRAKVPICVQGGRGGGVRRGFRDNVDAYSQPAPSMRQSSGMGS